MSNETGVSWASHSWGPWRGCDPVSEGCENCYGARQMRSHGIDPRKLVRQKCFDAPLKKTRKGEWKIPDGSVVFVCPWGDFFHEAGDEWRAAAFDIMLCRSGVTFLIPTKRPERFGLLTVGREAYAASHIWLGVTAENQEMADERIHKLISTDWPGRKFVSCEPQLGQIILPDGSLAPVPGALDWVICGGESGPQARPFDLSWARDLRDQCKAAGVPFWMKQLGGWPNRREKLEELPPDLRIRERPEA